MEVFVLFWLLTSLIVAAYANKRGRNGAGFFVLALLTSPLVALIVLLVMADKTELAQREVSRREEHERQVASLQAIAGRAAGVEPPRPSSAGSVAEELAKLAELRDRGILTDEEFQAQKAATLRR